jgi:RNA polymerase sigma-70 factor (ECF subfamily)
MTPVERELVERAQAGSRDAFTALVHESVDRLYAIAYRILRDPDQAEDAVQQALIDVWDDLPDLRDPERFEGWSYRLVVRSSYREARRQRATRRVREIDELRAVDDAPGESEAMVRIASRDEIERAFRVLTPEHRAVLVLRFYVGLPVSEIAEALQIPLGTAASRLHYALRDLRAACESADREPGIRRVWA